MLLALHTAMMPGLAQGQQAATRALAKTRAGRVGGVAGASSDAYFIDLSGTWRFGIDSLDRGVEERWYARDLKGAIRLPGSMTSNHLGNDIGPSTPWTGSIIDSSWFIAPEYAKYRVPGHVKVPFWLQPEKYYKGAAWYQREVTIPVAWRGRRLRFSMERCHWQSTLWIDGIRIGENNSLATPHVYDLPTDLSPGVHRISVRIDNRILDVNPGPDSHSITDHTQTNWNGIIGQIRLVALPAVNIDDVQIYPDIDKREVKVRILIHAQPQDIHIRLNGQSLSDKKSLPAIEGTFHVGDPTMIEMVYPMGKHPLLWDEFHPHLYTLHVSVVQGRNIMDVRSIGFGMRRFATRGSQFTINGRPTFLRGTLECAIFPRTGFPPTAIAAWLRIFRIARSYGLNHMRFHSWCPPEAAFAAADRAGFYLHVEMGSWANSGSAVGDGAPIDRYLYEESNRIVQAYGNHPSFCMMAYGNEPAGQNLQAYLKAFVEYWKKKDPRRLYTTGAGWPVIPESDYNSSPDPRIQHWDEGLKSIINHEPPSTDFDWRRIIAAWPQPTVSHEIGQWCVYPDFKEIRQYTGVLKAKNFEIFRDRLKESGLLPLADSLLLASGKLQVLCYKADIEAALRTPGFGGFQLLDLHDFPGQGTALVGVLNAFWGDKGYVDAQQYSRFCNDVVPLARFTKMSWLNNEELDIPIEVANFSDHILQGAAAWEIRDPRGRLVAQGHFPAAAIPIGNGIPLGEIRWALLGIAHATKLEVSVIVAGHRNSWEIFVYPAKLPSPGAGLTSGAGLAPGADPAAILVTQALDRAAMEDLERGGKVLLTIREGSLPAGIGGNIKIGFSTIFWNTAWTNSQPPTTLGILCDPRHPALRDFPTEYFSNYQWWDAMTHSNAIRLDSLAPGLRPIVRVIDDWVSAANLGLIFECRVGRGRLLVSGIDLLTGSETRPEARQLLYSLEKYMLGTAFDPATNVDAQKVKGWLQ